MILEEVKEQRAFVSGRVRSLVDKYVSGVESEVEGTHVEKAEAGVGGFYDGSRIVIAQSTLTVHNSIQETIQQTVETGKHEQYHADHAHMDPLQTGLSAQGTTVVQMGGHKFTEEALIEGLTVNHAGDEFVSHEYRGFRMQLLAAVSDAGLTIATVEQAVNDERSLMKIDDLNRQWDAADADPQVVLAA